MKLPRICACIVLLLIGELSFAQSTDKWTLERCIKYALDSNITIRQAELNARISNNQYVQSYMNTLPSVDANIGYNLNYGNTLNPITYDFEPGNSQSLQGGIQGNLTLFNGLQQLHGIQKAKYDLIASKYDYENARNNVALNVASAYLQILLNMEIQQVAEKQKALTATQREVVNSKIKAGALSETAIYEVDAQLSRDEANLVSTTGNNTLSILSLKQLLQITNEQSFEIASPEVDADKLPSVADLNAIGIYNYAVLNQPSIKGAEARWKSSNASRKIAIGYLTPTISAFFNLNSGYSTNIYSLRGSEVITTPFNQQLNNNYRKVVGFSLNVPLFGKGQRFINISNARLQQQITELDLQNAKNKLRQDIEQAYANARAAAESYQANKKSMESSQKAYQTTELRYKAGAASNFDIQQAKNNLVAAESEMIKAKYTYVFRLKILDFYQGKPITLN